MVFGYKDRKDVTRSPQYGSWVVTLKLVTAILSMRGLRHAGRIKRSRNGVYIRRDASCRKGLYFVELRRLEDMSSSSLEASNHIWQALDKWPGREKLLEEIRHPMSIPRALLRSRLLIPSVLE